MDKLLPRLASISLKTFSNRRLLLLPDRYSYCSCSAFAPTAPTPTSLLISPSSSSTNDYNFPAWKDYSSATSKPAMDEHPKPRDGRNEEAQATMDPSNRAFDEILPHILNIYGSRGTATDFEIYAPNATFEDPLMRAQGVKQIKSAFYSIPKELELLIRSLGEESKYRLVFSESRIVEYSIKENIISPGNKEILMDNKQYYKFLGKDINMISLIKLQLQDGKIIRHEDLWDKKPLKNRETVPLPLVGRILELTRRGSMLATHALMGFGKDPPATL